MATAAGTVPGVNPAKQTKAQLVTAYDRLAARYARLAERHSALQAAYQAERDHTAKRVAMIHRLIDTVQAQRAMGVVA